MPGRASRTIHCDPHPLADLRAFVAELPVPLGELATPAEVAALLRPGAGAPVGPPTDEVRQAVRALLRHGGYKPSGRGRPASEYLAKAAEAGGLDPINPAVDGCNVASLHSGLPISVVDLDLLKEPLHIRVGGPDEAYVFNPSGQVLKLAGLIRLEDAEGPCGSAVKDSQRTKTHPGTRRTLSIVWGTKAVPALSDATVHWYRELLGHLGAETAPVRLEVAGE